MTPPSQILVLGPRLVQSPFPRGIYGRYDARANHTFVYVWTTYFRPNISIRRSINNFAAKIGFYSVRHSANLLLFYELPTSNRTYAPLGFSCETNDRPCPVCTVFLGPGGVFESPDTTGRRTPPKRP